MTRLTLEFRGRDDFDGHDGFKDGWACLRERLAECTDSGKSECQLGRIDGMRKTILENEANTANLIARKRALLTCLEEALITKRDASATRS